jgi:hypothetical protein
LVHETIFLNIVLLLLHHVAHAKSAKAWNNLYATLERHVGNRSQFCQELGANMIR